MEKIKLDQSGFTLLELAVVLIIISLFISCVLKGQELIDLAKIKKFEADFKDIQLFIYGYQNKYRAIPGDDPNVVAHVGGILATSPAGLQGNGVINGNWNSTTTTDESFLFWQHVRLGGLATGPTVITDPTYKPVNVAGGAIGVQGGTSMPANSPINGGPGQTNPIHGIYIICSADIPGKFVKVVDTDLDDGNVASGSIMATPVFGYAIGAIATATPAIQDATPYILCMGI